MEALEQLNARVLPNAILLHVHARINRLRRIRDRRMVDGRLSRLLVLAKRSHSLQVASFGFVIRNDVSSEDITSSIGFGTVFATVRFFASVCTCRNSISVCCRSPAKCETHDCADDGLNDPVWKRFADMLGIV